MSLGGTGWPSAAYLGRNATRSLPRFKLSKHPLTSSPVAEAVTGVTLWNGSVGIERCAAKFQSDSTSTA